MFGSRRDSLGPGAGGVDDHPSAHVGFFKLGRGIAAVKAGQRDALPFPDEKGVGMFFFQMVSGIGAAHGEYAAGAAGKKIALQGECPEHIDDDGASPGGFGAIEKFGCDNIHGSI